MASDLSFAEYAVDQLRKAGDVTMRKMFGEFAVYLDGKVVALIADNQLYVKPTDAGRAILGKVPEAPPYPGAKSYLLLTEQLDDSELITSVIVATARELPAPKPKKPAKKK